MLILPVPPPPPCAASLLFRAASCASYRLRSMSRLVCGFNVPPGLRYSQSAQAPMRRGAAPGPREAEPPPLGNPRGLSSSDFGFFPAPAIDTGRIATGRGTRRPYCVRFNAQTSPTVASESATTDIITENVRKRATGRHKCGAEWRIDQWISDNE